MRTDLIMMACLAAFAVAMVASAGDPSPLDQSAGSESTASVPSESATAEQTAEQSQATADAGPASDDVSSSSSSPLSMPTTRPMIVPPCIGTCAVAAGYRWAQEREILDADDCDEAPEALVEGCKKYADGQTHAGVDRDLDRKFD